ncbi:MAG: 2-phosphosulfolactate phosphatase [Gemmatimonadetes bacterium]|nr:2-phosphosulfolactate phosphatase [Gemmatimonadota bacterium]
MKLSVYFTPVGLPPAAIAGKPVIVVDILRATTSIVAAIASGARAVVPAASGEEALRIAQNLEKDGRLLAGERGCVRIPGFDLGNSPLEMTPEVVARKTVVLATTNGTPALLAADAGRPVIVGAVTNFTAAAAAARAAVAELEEEELSIVCAGREKLFALEDAYAAGRFAQAVLARKSRAKRSLELNDGAMAAIELVRRYGTKWKLAVTASAAARELQRLKFKADVQAATETDQYDVVPVYADRRITRLTRG